MITTLSFMLLPFPKVFVCYFYLNLKVNNLPKFLGGIVTLCANIHVADSQKLSAKPRELRVLEVYSVTPDECGSTKC